jgi:hypothetical protein
MNNPWDPFPLPTRGDDNARLTFEGVGRVTSHWEALEFELSRLYSIFAGDPDGEAMQTYGTGKIFRDRLVALRQLAEKHFIATPTQDLEGIFDGLANAAEGFGSRRNEVAHGIVCPVQNISFFMGHFGQHVGGKPQYLLIPPYYTVRNHQDGLPLYSYSSIELSALTQHLLILLERVRAYRRDLLNRTRGARSEQP